jgi:glycosyltransferase involved in cell wall biosynthesis
MTNFHYKNKPFFSIITVVNDDFKGLTETVKSIEEQVCTDYEHVIKATPNDQKVNSYLNSINKKFYVFDIKEDFGIYDAMNQGLNVISGSYVIFLNTGDIFKDNSVLNSVKKQIQDYDILYGDTIDNKDNLYKSGPIKNWKKMCFCHQSVFVRSSLFNKKFNLDYSICADREFFASQKSNLAIKRSSLIISIIKKDGYSNKKPIETIKEINRINQKYFKEFWIIGTFRFYYQMIRSFTKKFLKGVSNG